MGKLLIQSVDLETSFYVEANCSMPLHKKKFDPALVWFFK